MNNPYHILGISVAATDQDIKKAFRKLSMECHPDRVAPDDPERAEKIAKFTQLSEAKDTLLDPMLRQAFNRGGWDMVNHMIASRHEMEQRRRKCDPIVVHKTVSLQQLYNKETIKIEVPVPVYEEDGTMKETPFPMEFPVSTLGKIVAQNAGVQKPDHVPGDIIVVTALEENCPFEVRGNDLVYSAKLGIRDLIRGYAVVVPHPHINYLVRGHYNPDNDDDNVKVFPGKGLPSSGTGCSPQGDLVVVLTPDLKEITSLDPDTAKAICTILDHKYGEGKENKETLGDIKDITGDSITPRHTRESDVGCPVQ